ncbi:hypothetical protein, conserved [Leishmania tarentolae]|uniref:Uncharacterized protein n=1 Tax=Leishmania tarentolae TaxID=5689 RepID=A0A640KMG1_LEITA|nr:hypothetical protein, conserved [Leishmania tarentolae]
MRARGSYPHLHSWRRLHCSFVSSAPRVSPIRRCPSLVSCICASLHIYVTVPNHPVWLTTYSLSVCVCVSSPHPLSSPSAAERTQARVTTMPPPPRHRYHSLRGLPSRPGQQQHYAKKEVLRHTGKKMSAVAGPSSTGPSASAVAAASTAREEALRGALAKALSHGSVESGAASASENTLDTYGNGSPTDRLQFGYSPSVVAEAVAFHSRFTKDAWVTARKRNGRMVFVKKQKLKVTNCEPITSILKLQSHWRRMNAFQSDVRGETVRKLKAEDLDMLVDMLASKQRIGGDEDEV